jgi:murein DD-endopeptidase MepM/ murein hydrolase activator NlpD
VGPSIFTDAPQAALHSELFACNGGGGSNIGEIGWRGEVVSYTPYIHTPAGALLRNPTQAACLSSGFGWRSSASGGGRQHSGLDLANPEGGFVFAAADGWVSTVEWRGGYGLVIEIDHGSGVRTLYAHLNEANPGLQSGVFVNSGTAIARMGATGNATGVHLHYEVNVDGLTVDPLQYGRLPTYVSAPAPKDASLTDVSPD